LGATLTWWLFLHASSQDCTAKVGSARLG
jgi:hypothetical protein